VKGRRRLALLLLGAALTLAAGCLASGPALAGNGAGAQYQIELSANAPGPGQMHGVGGLGGGGIWLWIALNRDGSGDYAGSDCGHGEGAAKDAGDIEGWYFGDGDGTPNPAGDWVVVPGIQLNGLAAVNGGQPYVTSVVVPRTDGHYSSTFGAYFLSLPFPPPVLASGFSELEVAP
jgi:hypothetical protein